MVISQNILNVKKSNTVVFVFILILFNISACKSQQKCNDREFIEIELEKGRYQSIRLFDEGLICTSVDSNLVSTTVFFPKKDIDFRKVSDLQDYLFSEPFFTKDTTIDDPSLIVYDNSNWLKISVVINSTLHNIYWVDGECKYLEKCLSLINDIIPFEKRDIFLIRHR